jgi:hypothetical protein
VFYIDVAKVDRDIAYVAMVVHVCCKLLFPMFHLLFRRMLQVCLFWMLHIFHTYVASVLSRCCVCFCNGFKCFSDVFANVSDACSKCFICLQTYVASVASECFKSRTSVASAASSQCLLLPTPAGHPPPPSSLFDVGDVRSGMDSVWTREMAWEKDCKRGSRRRGASKPVI